MQNVCVCVSTTRALICVNELRPQPCDTVGRACYVARVETALVAIVPRDDVDAHARRELVFQAQLKPCVRVSVCVEAA